MTKVKLSEQDLRNLIRVALSEAPGETGTPAAPAADNPNDGFSSTNLANFQDDVVSKLIELDSKLNKSTVVPKPPTITNYRFSHFARAALQELGLEPDWVSNFESENPNSLKNSVRGYMKATILLKLAGKSLTLPAADGEPEVKMYSEDSTGYHQVPYIPVAAGSNTNVFINEFLSAADKVCVEEVLKAFQVSNWIGYKSKEFWDALDNAAFVKAAAENIRANGICDSEEYHKATAKAISGELGRFTSQFRDVYKQIDTSSYESYFVLPVMYPGIWRNIGDEGSPLYTPWKMTLAACNMLNNAMAVKMGPQALALKLTQASRAGITQQGLAGGAALFNPLQFQQFISPSLNESKLTFSSLSELRRVINAALMISHREHRQIRPSTGRQTLKEGWGIDFLKLLYTAGRDSISSVKSGAARNADEIISTMSTFARSTVDEVAGNAGGFPAKIEKLIGDLNLPDDAATKIALDIAALRTSYINSVFDGLKSVTDFVTNNVSIPGATANVLARPCVIDLTTINYPQTKPANLERVRLLLNYATLIDLATVAGDKAAAADFAKDAEALARGITGGDVQQVRSMIESLSRSPVLSGMTRRVVDGVILTATVGDTTVKRIVNPEKFASALEDISSTSFYALSRGTRPKIKSTSPTLKSFEDIVTNTTEYAPKGTPIINLPRSALTSNPDLLALRDDLVALRDSSYDSVSQASELRPKVEAALAENSLEFIRSRSSGAALALLDDPQTVVNVTAKGEAAAKGQSLISTLAGFGAWKYNPEETEGFVNTLGTILYIQEKGLSELQKTKLSSMGMIGKAAAKVGSYSYSQVVTRGLEKLSQTPLFKGIASRLAKTNWVKVYLAKSAVTFLVTGFAYGSGWTGPSFESENPTLVGFINILRNLNNTSPIQIGLADLIYDIIQSNQGDDLLLSEEEINALMSSETYDILINAMSYLLVGASVTSGNFPQLSSTTRSADEGSIDKYLSDLAGIVSGAANIFVSGGTSAARSSVDFWERRADVAAADLRVVIDATKLSDGAQAILNAGNDQFRLLETLRLDLVKNMNTRLETQKSALKSGGRLDDSFIPLSSYSPLRQDYEKVDAVSDPISFITNLRNVSDVEYISLGLQGEGPIGPGGLPVGTLYDVQEELLAKGKIEPADTASPDASTPASRTGGGGQQKATTPIPPEDLQRLNKKFMDLSAQYQDLIKSLAVKEASGAAAAPAGK